MIFCLRQLQERYIEQDRPLYMAFVDFSKAFDTVGGTGQRKYGCPEKFITMIEVLHTGMMANVSVGGEVSESFKANGGEARLRNDPHALPHLPNNNARRGFPRPGDGVYIHSRQSADLFNVAHFRAKTNTTRILMRELLFVDDSALVAHSAEEMQNMVNAFFNASPCVHAVQGNIYRAIELSTLLYGAEAWTLCRRQVKKHHAFMMQHLRSLMRITWMDKETNKDMFERTGLPSIYDILIRMNLRWTGHLMRMSLDRKT